MSDDRRRPDSYAALRDESLRAWITDTVYPYSPVLREALDTAGLGQRGVRRSSDLTRLPATTVAALGDGKRFVLEPTATAIAAHAPLEERVRLRVADVLGRRSDLARTRIDPDHRPVSWTVAGAPSRPLFTASTSRDLDRLADLGRRSLAISGVERHDRVLVLDPPGAGIATWQLLAGCRDAGVAVLQLDAGAAPALWAAATPTVLAGRAATLRTAVAAGVPAGVRTLVVLDGPPLAGAQHQDLARSGANVAEWCSPPATRAAWVRCPGGNGFHTWPTHELVEILDAAGQVTGTGELTWSAVGWHGSVWLRVRTGVTATVEAGACDRCGRTTPRVVPVELLRRRQR